MSDNDLRDFAETVIALWGIGARQDAMDMIHAHPKDLFLVARLMKAVIFTSLKHYDQNDADATSESLLAHLEREVS